MLLSLTAEYKESPLVKILGIDESTGDVQISFVDSSDANSLYELQNRIESDITFADFQVVNTKTEDYKDAYELQHSRTDCAPGEPNIEDDGMIIKDSPSFVGFLRKLIYESGSIVLPLRDVPEQDIPYWMTAPISTMQFTDDMGIRISHLIPGQEEDHWRWTSSSILMADNNDKFSDVTGHRFLCLTEFDMGDYKEFLIEHPERTVLQENGGSVTYRVFSVTKDLPLYTHKSNVLVNPLIISRLKFAADSYKLALYSLTTGLFQDKKVEQTGWGDRQAPLVTGRFLKLKNVVPVSKKTATAMMDFLLDSLSGRTTPESEAEFNKKFPHYLVYSSILKNQLSIFHGADVSQRQKFRAYRALKNMETYYYLMLQECRYHAMFDNNAFLFNLWTSNMSFESDIPNYKITISGGGGTWQPNVSYFL